MWHSLRELGERQCSIRFLHVLEGGCAATCSVHLGVSLVHPSEEGALMALQRYLPHCNGYTAPYLGAHTVPSRKWLQLYSCTTNQFVDLVDLDIYRVDSCRVK